MSGGQRQRIAVARAILRDSPVLLLDEPTTGLSPADTRQLMELLRPVVAGRTVIVITHDAAVAALADRVIALGSQRPDGPAARSRVFAQPTYRPRRLSPERAR
jgi:ABC-type transport system involved in cytochrome bd biosynthesis fused ATPase/permease subunit